MLIAMVNGDLYWELRVRRCVPFSCHVHSVTEAAPGGFMLWVLALGLCRVSSPQRIGTRRISLKAPHLPALSPWSQPEQMRDLLCTPLV